MKAYVVPRCHNTRTVHSPDLTRSLCMHHISPASPGSLAGNRVSKCHHDVEDMQGTEQRAGQLFNPFDDNQVASVTGSPPNPAQPKQLMLPPPPRLPVSPGQPMLPAVRPPRPTRPPKRFRPPTGAQPDSAWAGLQAFAPEARCVTKPRRAKRPPTIFRAPTGAQPESTWADLQAFALTARCVISDTSMRIA